MSYRKLFRNLKNTLSSIQASNNIHTIIEVIIESLIKKEVAREFGIIGARLYKKVNGAYELISKYGNSGKAKIGYTIPSDYAGVKGVIENGFIYMAPNDPGYNKKIELPIGLKPFSAIALGEDSDFMISFSLSRNYDREKIIYFLGTIKHVADSKIRQQYFEDTIYEAKIIQKSLFPEKLPKFEGFDIHAQNVPADMISGDVYDFIKISDLIMGIAVADVSGHGIPAALQTRDVVIGIRMGMEEDLKIVKTIEKLNRLIHRGRITSKFIALFYGEIEKNGTLVYCNAGLVPPLLFKKNYIKELTRGGPIIGPKLDAKYEREFALMEKGDILAIFTDGLVETFNTKNEEYGVNRLKKLILQNKNKSSEELVNLIINDVSSFRNEIKQNDDLTIVLIKKVT